MVIADINIHMQDPNLVKPDWNIDTEIEVLERYDRQVPRYTSYPPINFFTSEFSDETYRDNLIASNQNGPRNLSFYFHVPFCPKRCLFCGCTTYIAQPGSVISDYLTSLNVEMDMVLPLIDSDRKVTQIHFGGGTPNAAPLHRITALVDRLRKSFVFAPEAEIAMECDPNLILPAHLTKLREAGFTRLSFGIQDVRADVLESVNRKPSRMPPQELISRCRDLGFRGLNLDLICGLPYQTPTTFLETVETIIGADPDRISVFSYAHVPWMMEHQRKLENHPMPTAKERARMTLESRRLLESAGFVPIGLDHFVKADDELATAQKLGKLHRNFQGYCSKRNTGQVYSFGASAISQFEHGYGQNFKELAPYQAAIAKGRLPVERVYAMTPRDRAVRDIINALMCYGELDTSALGDEQEAADAAKSPDWIAFQQDGLIECTPEKVKVTARGRLALRLIASTFDPLLQKEAANRYSRSL